MRWASFGLIAVSLGVAWQTPAIMRAQTSYPPVDTSQLVRPADVTAAITAATPAPCSTPLPDTLTGSAGVAPTCMTRPDGTRPTAIQRANVVTMDASGSWAVTFGRPFTSTSPIVQAEAIQAGGATLPYQCGVTTRTATTASGTCWAATSQTNTVSLGVSLTNNPFAAKVPQGTAVMVVAGEPSQ